LKSKMVNKLTKRPSKLLSLVDKIVIANFCIVGAINYYGVIVAPNLADFNKNELSKLVRTFCRTSKLNLP